MQQLLNKNIILGVSGGIAAYKSADLVRKLMELGAKVQVVMTASAHEFITPVTFQAISGRSVRDTLFDETAEAAMGHIELARWADYIVIAPATANTIAAITHGLANDLLTTLCLASDAPIAIAPAMNQAMWNAQATQYNIDILQNRGINILGPGVGEQACKEIGAGRMLEPMEIREEIIRHFSTTKQILAGYNILLTAGPTQEAIDPVRFISNHSSGKMGYALAEVAKKMGAKVTLVSGPTQLTAPKGIKVVSVTSAQEMLDAVMLTAHLADIFIAVAAVADYRLNSINQQKIKKSSDVLTLNLVKNPDILSEVSSMSTNRPFCVGFAAETDNLETYAREKLKSKNLDLVAANLITKDQETVFNSDNNALEIFLRDNSRISLSKTNKSRIAEKLLNLIAKVYTK